MSTHTHTRTHSPAAQKPPSNAVILPYLSIQRIGRYHSQMNAGTCALGIGTATPGLSWALSSFLSCLLFVCPQVHPDMQAPSTPPPGRGLTREQRTRPLCCDEGRGRSGRHGHEEVNSTHTYKTVRTHAHTRLWMLLCCHVLAALRTACLAPVSISMCPPTWFRLLVVGRFWLLVR